MTAHNDSERQSPPIRVLIANLSAVMVEIVVQALQHPDMILIHYAKDLAELAEAVRSEIDMLIIGAPYVYPPPIICRKLWQSSPRLKILVLTPSGDAAVIHWLHVRQKRLKTVSASTLTDAIRQVQRLDLIE